MRTTTRRQGGWHVSMPTRHHSDSIPTLYPENGRFQFVRPGHDRLELLHQRPVRRLPVDVPRQMDRGLRAARCAVYAHDIADLVARLAARNVRILLRQHCMWGRRMNRVRSLQSFRPRALYSPTTSMSPWSETVWKEGASADTSHRYFPLEESSIGSSTTCSLVEFNSYT
uniref:Uncharacterized protein n=1 Tax=Anopheles atroparvus TaxID=41427 RepID=A0A182JG82_ANOAO